MSDTGRMYPLDSVEVYVHMPEFSTEFWAASALAILGLVLGLGATLAMDAKTKGEFRFAIACFIFSSLMVVSTIVLWGVTTQVTMLKRTLLCALLFAIVGVLLVEALRWTHGRHMRARGSEPPPSNPTPPTSREPLNPHPELPPVNQHPKQEQQKCQITATANSQFVSRIHARGMLPPPGQETHVEPAFQELFYEWNISVTANHQAQNVIVVIHEDGPTEAALIRTIPENASVSDLKPAWMSGFNERNRPPDYYLRKIQFPRLSPNTKATITFRWPLRLARGQNQLSPTDFKSYDFDLVLEDECTATKHSYDRDQQFLVLMTQFQAFLKMSGRKDQQPLKIILNPDEPLPLLAPGEVETTVEAFCENPECGRFTIHQMEARVNRDSKPQ